MDREIRGNALELEIWEPSVCQINILPRSVTLPLSSYLVARLLRLSLQQ